MQQRKRLIQLALAFGGMCLMIVAGDSNAKSGKPDWKEGIKHSDSTTLSEAQLVFIHAGLDKTSLSYDIFEKAYAGYQQLRQNGKLKKSLLAIADMSVPSNEKRLFILDLSNPKLLVNTYVAHGRNSGDRLANQFSNRPQSLQSSLGFFVTGETYTGNNGYSMRLMGMERSINDKALERAIVMHGAPYVSEQMAKQTGRIGRSWGCPAVSMKEHKQIIDLLKNGSCLFIYAPKKDYLAASVILNNRI